MTESDLAQKMLVAAPQTAGARVLAAMPTIGRKLEPDEQVWDPTWTEEEHAGLLLRIASPNGVGIALVECDEQKSTFKVSEGQGGRPCIYIPRRLMRTHCPRLFRAIAGTVRTNADAYFKSRIH